MDESVRPLLAGLGFREYEDFARGSAGTVVARTRTSVTRRLEWSDGGGASAFYLKQFHYDGRHRRDAIRPHKGAVEARNYRLMRTLAGVAVPDVIATGCRRAGWRLRDAFILTRGISGAQPLDAWWRERESRGELPPGLPREIGEKLLAMVAALHRADFYHVDLQWRNILIRESAGRVELFVLDSSRGGRRRLPWMRWHFRMRDLSSMEKSARQFVSRARRVRFLREYLRRTGCGEPLRRLLRRIMSDRARKDGPSAPSSASADARA